MAASLATLESRIASRLRPDDTTPTISDVDNLTTEVVQLWANELSIDVIKRLVLKPIEIQALTVLDKLVALTSGSGSLPTDFAYPSAVKCEVTIDDSAVRRNAQVYTDPREFAGFDGLSFATTALVHYPQSLIAAGKLSVKPTSITKAYVDYYKKHPAISSSQATLWSDLADNVLLELLVAKYYESRDDFEMQGIAIKEAERLAA